MKGNVDAIVVRSRNSEKKISPTRILITKLGHEEESMPPKVDSRKIQRHQLCSEKFEGCY